MEFGKGMLYNIKISSSANKGYIAKVGCGTFVFETKESLKEAFNDYIDNPKKMELLYNESFQGGETGEAPVVTGEPVLRDAR